MRQRLIPLRQHLLCTNDNGNNDINRCRNVLQECIINIDILAEERGYHIDREDRPGVLLSRHGAVGLIWNAIDQIGQFRDNEPSNQQLNSISKELQMAQNTLRVAQ